MLPLTVAKNERKSTSVVARYGLILAAMPNVLAMRFRRDHKLNLLTAQTPRE